jgi:hypothetical protein
MGSPESLYTPKQLKALSKKQRAELAKELKRVLRASPAARMAIAAHNRANKSLRTKLSPTLRRFRTEKSAT